MQFNKICVVGMGYIGLPTAAVFASRKIQVVGVDVNQQAVDTINRGEIHIVEPELDTVVHGAVKGGYLTATTQPERADAFLVAVPTPFKGDNHEPDLSYIEAASKSIAPVLEAGNLVILESTSPVGATEQMESWLAEARPDLSFPTTGGEGSDIRVAHCPERVLPGRVMTELVENDRIIGGITSACSNAAAKLYKTFVVGECILTNAKTAEMAKLTENSYRDVNIAFANELSVICDDLDIDVWELIRLANRHPRVNILQPGPGVGGHCIAVDPWFIVSRSPEKAKLIAQARRVNDAKPAHVISKLRSLCEKAEQDRPKTTGPLNIVIYGLSFKPNIDDLRESPALSIATRIAELDDVNVFVVEPNVGVIPPVLDGLASLVSIEESFELADVALLLVGHREFGEPDFQNCLPRFVLDTCGILENSI